MLQTLQTARMRIMLNIVIASVLAQTTLCASISLSSHEDTKSMTTISVELLSSFKNCIVYIFDYPYKTKYDSLASTKYIQFFTENMNCAVFVDSARQYRNYSFNERFGKLEPHPLFTKYTTTLFNLYTPCTTSTILKTKKPVLKFYRVIAMYNIPFNYVLIFMGNEEFLSIDNVGLFSKLATVSSPAVYLLIVDEQDVNVASCVHAFQAAPFLFKVIKLQEMHIQQLNQIIYKDPQGAISRYWGDIIDWRNCRFGAAISTEAINCSIDVISEYLNITFLNDQEHPEPKLSINEISISKKLISQTPWLTRVNPYNGYFVSYAVDYGEPHFVCIARLTSTGFMAFVQAYDLMTWIVASTSCLCLSAAIAAMATKTTASFSSKVVSSIPVVVMLLIERFYGYGQVVRSASRQMVLVITLWAFGAMLLGMCYSGNMISELTSPSLPECPHDMQQLAENEDYPIFSDFSIVVGNGSKVSYLHFEIAEYLLDYAARNGSLLCLLQKFGDKLTFVDYTSTLLNPSYHNRSSKTVLAYASRRLFVKAYEMWSMAYSRNIRVLRGGDLPFFNYWSPTLVQSNFLGVVLQRYLGYVFECGIFEYWKIGLAACVIDTLFNMHGKRGEKAPGKELVRKSNLAVIWRKHYPELIGGEAPLDGVAMENLNAVFQVFGVCMLLALSAFMKERRICKLAAYHLLQVAKRVPLFLNRISENLVKLRCRVVNRAVVAIEQEST